MEITLTLKDLGFILIVAAAVVMLFYLAGVFKNLIVTLKHTNKIMADAEVISGIAAAKASEVDKLIDDVTASVGSVAEMIKGNQSTLKALTNLINAVGSLKNLLTGKSDEEN